MLGDQRLAGFATVPDVGWKIWVNQAHAEVQAELNATYRRVLGWTLLALLATVTLAVIVATHVSSRHGPPGHGRRHRRGRHGTPGSPGRPP
jgi:hypothetical protein